MLTSLGRLIFGASTLESSDKDDFQPITLRTTEGDFGWELVDADGEDGTDYLDNESNVDSTLECSRVDLSDEYDFSCLEADEQKANTGYIGFGFTDDFWDMVQDEATPSRRRHYRLSDSWVLAPNPVFIHSPKMNDCEPNALENLLIEHPSMSVYSDSSFIHLSNNEQPCLPTAASKVEQLLAEVEEWHSPRAGELVSAPSCHPVCICTATTQPSKCIQERRQQAANWKRMSRSSIARNNKTYFTPKNLFPACTRILQPQRRRNLRTH